MAEHQEESEDETPYHLVKVESHRQLFQTNTCSSNILTEQIPAPTAPRILEVQYLLKIANTLSKKRVVVTPLADIFTPRTGLDQTDTPGSKSMIGNRHLPPEELVELNEEAEQAEMHCRYGWLQRLRFR